MNDGRLAQSHHAVDEDSPERGKSQQRLVPRNTVVDVEH